MEADDAVGGEEAVEADAWRGLDDADAEEEFAIEFGGGDFVEAAFGELVDDEGAAGGFGFFGDDFVVGLGVCRGERGGQSGGAEEGQEEGDGPGASQRIMLLWPCGFMEVTALKEAIDAEDFARVRTLLHVAAEYPNLLR